MKTKQEAIDYVLKNCFDAVTPHQVSYILDLLEEFGMKPPHSHDKQIIEQGVTFTIPVHKWSE